jgi:hypothetical protein
MGSIKSMNECGILFETARHGNGKLFLHGFLFFGYHHSNHSSLAMAMDK